MAASLSFQDTVRNPDGVRPCVLVIDDEPDYRSTVASVLGSAGYDVREACDGVAGLAACKLWRPALVLVDFDMPYMNGLEFLAAKEADAELAGIPVVMITGSDVRVGHRATRLLAKPVSAAVMLEAVAALATGSQNEPSMNGRMR